jgi:hypothetical protein
MELISVLALNSLFPAFLLSVLVLLLARLNWLLRLLLAIVVLFLVEITITIATLYSFGQLAILPSEHTMEATRQYLAGEYVARSIVFWVVGIRLIHISSARIGWRFALAITTILLAWELVFFFVEVPINSLFIGNPFWRFVSVAFYCALVLFVRRKMSPSSKMANS